jgi:hypothetical protein
MKWITRERPKIDRVACPWLIAGFIDANPELLELAPQCAGLLAISLGLSRLFADDHEQLRHGFVVYDAFTPGCVRRATRRTRGIHSAERRQPVSDKRILAV